jgi:hypothetical protein
VSPNFQNSFPVGIDLESYAQNVALIESIILVAFVDPMSLYLCYQQSTIVFVEKMEISFSSLTEDSHGVQPYHLCAIVAFREISSIKAL